MEPTTPHPASTGWTLRLTTLELTRIFDMSRAINPGDDSEEHVTVGLVGPATRRWVIEGPFTFGWIETAGGQTDPVEAVAIPRFVLRSALAMAEEMGEVFLYQQETLGTFALYSGDEWLFADGFSSAPFEPSVDTEFDPGSGTWVSATLPVISARRMTTSYENNIHMIEPDGRLLPYMTLAVGQPSGRLRWTAAWDRWDMPTVSGETTADTKGQGMIALWPVGMLRMIGHIPQRGDVTISWDDSTEPYVWVTGEDWGIRCLVGEEMSHRYIGPLNSALSDAQFELDDYEGPLPNPLVYSRGTMTLTVNTINQGDGDYFRFATCVASDVPQGRAVQRELNALNDKFMGAKVLLSGGNVFLAVDIPATPDESLIAAALETVDAYRKRCEGFDAILPLFEDVEDEAAPDTRHD